MLKDMRDWARFTGVDIACPPKGHPISSVRAMRACLLLKPLGKLVPFARACFSAYFGDQKPISEDWVLQELCEAVAVDGDWLLAEISRDTVKGALRANL